MFEACLYFNTAALARQLEREWSAAFQPFGLLPPQAFLLRAVLKKPGLLQRELAHLMGISRPTATRTLDGLVAKGLLERRPTERDGRESAVYPTSAGEALHQSLDTASASVTQRLKAQLGAEHFSTTVGAIRGIRNTLLSP